MPSIKLLTIYFLFSLPIVLLGQSVRNDLSFNPNDFGFNFGQGCINGVSSSHVFSDGTVLINGNYNQQTYSSIVKLLPNGRIDSSFRTNYGGDFTIQPDGKILVYNQFLNLGMRRILPTGQIDTSFNTVFHNDYIKSVVIQADGKILIGGVFTTVNGQIKNHLARLNSDGSLDTTFMNIGTDWEVFSCLVQSDGQLLIGGWFNHMNGTPAMRLVRLNTDGSIDTNFNIGTGVGGIVYDLAQQADSKLLVAGAIAYFNDTTTIHLVRLNLNGTLDTSFATNTFTLSSPNGIYSIDIQPDNKIVVGGSFELSNQLGEINRVARLLPDGQIDPSFSTNNYLNESVKIIRVKPDGKLIVAGDFQQSAISNRNGIAQLTSNGTLDSTFNWELGADDRIVCSAIQADGKMIIAGMFKYVNSYYVNGLARIFPNGNIDTTFHNTFSYNPDIQEIVVLPDGKILVGGNNLISRLLPNGDLDMSFANAFQNYSGSVQTISLQSDGKIVIGGSFANSFIPQYNSIARLNSNGTFDLSFSPLQDIDGLIRCSAIQADGRIIIGGDFTNISGNSRTYLARLNSNGTLDLSYNFQINDIVSAMDLQADGKLLIGGRFTSINNLTKKCFARLNSNGSVDLSFQTENNIVGNPEKLKSLPGGKFLAVGGFGTYHLLRQDWIARFQSNGTIDYTFNSGYDPNNMVYTFEFAPDSSLYIFGDFTCVDSIGRNRMSKLEICEASIGPTTYVTDCNNYTWTNGQTYNFTNEYLQFVPSQSGCDSILFLNLTLNYTTSLTQDTACRNYTWTNGLTFNQSGVYTQTLMNSVGCDSIATLYLTIIPVSHSAIWQEANGSLSVYGPTLQHQWINCSTNQPIQGETGTNFLPTNNGNYAVITIYDDGCIDTSDCIVVTNLGVNEVDLSMIYLHPNPTSDQVTITMTVPSANLRVYDIQGKLVAEQKVVSGSEVSLKEFQTGVYLFEVISEGNRTVKRVVKN